MEGSCYSTYALGRGGSKGRVDGVATPLFGKFSNLSGYPCQPLFHTKNNVISYNISSCPIDHYKKTVAIPLLDSLIIKMQDRLSDEDRHARHLLCLVPSIIVNKALQLDDEVEGVLFWEKDIPFLSPLEMRYAEGKHSVSQQIGSFQTTFY